MSAVISPALRDRFSDLLSLGLALTYGAIMVIVGDASGDRPGIPWQVDVGLGVACCGPLLWRRRWPVGVAVALLPVGAVSVMATGPVLAAVFGVAARRRTATALALGVGNVATAPLYYLQQPDPRFPLWVDLVVRPIITAAAVGWGLFVGARRQLLAQLRERAERAEAEQRLRVDAARRAERTRIAREMHDVLAHRLSLVSLHAGALEIRTDAHPDEVATAAGVIRANAHQALQELRQVIGVLREGSGVCDASAAEAAGQAGATPPERPQPGLGDLPELVDAVRAAGTPVTCTTDVDAPDLPEGLGRTVYRFVQEGLTNARKHAPGSPVEVRIAGRPGGELRVRLVNPLPTAGGRCEVPGARTGLVGLGERVGLAGGRLEHGPDPVTGTFRLEAWLPWT